MPRKKRRPPSAEEIKLGLRFRELRLMLKPNDPVKLLAAQAKITPQQWYYYEAGKSGFPDQQKLKCCAVLGCTMRDLYEPLGTAPLQRAG
jgi:hypothetical protein